MFTSSLLCSVSDFWVTQSAFLGPRAPSPATERKRRARELYDRTPCSRFALFAGEGARGPIEWFELCTEQR